MRQPGRERKARRAGGRGVGHAHPFLFGSGRAGWVGPHHMEHYRVIPYRHGDF